MRSKPSASLNFFWDSMTNSSANSCLWSNSSARSLLYDELLATSGELLCLNSGFATIERLKGSNWLNLDLDL